MQVGNCFFSPLLPTFTYTLTLLGLIVSSPPFSILSYSLTISRSNSLPPSFFTRTLKCTIVSTKISPSLTLLQYLQHLMSYPTLSCLPDFTIPFCPGDGNFHALIMLRPDVAEDVKEAHRLAGDIAVAAISMGGTCTGEHGEFFSCCGNVNS